MTNHNPVFISSSESASFSEFANTTGSTALHHVIGTLKFRDSDHSDTHTTSAGLRSAVWSSGQAVSAATLAALGGAMTSSIVDDSNGTGDIQWSFNAPDDDFDFLAKNETLVVTYNVTVTDNHGGSALQTVVLTVTGTDDKPVISAAVTADVDEQPNQTLSLSPDTVHIALPFVDPDLDNTNYTATVLSASASGVTTGILPGFLGTAELMAFFQVDNVVKAAGQSNGVVNTTFSAPDLAFDYLAAGETLNIAYTVKLDDHAGGTSTQTVVVEVHGSNDAPTFISGPESAHLTEDQNVSPAGNLTAHGDLFFSDIDLSDDHTVSTTVTAARSGGGAVPLSNADLLAALSTTLEDSTGHVIGEVDWDFALPNSSVNFLSGGETLTLTYDINVTDPSNATATQVVTITILGTNHPVVITSGPESASLAEQSDTTGSPALDTTTPVPTGTINFTDADVSDTHTVAVSVASAIWSGGSGIPATTQTDLASALATTLHDSAGTGSGGVDWTFSIPDQDLDFLAAGETLTATYNVKVSDATTSATQTVTVTIDGANDAVVMTSGPESASLDEQAGMTGSTQADTTSPQTLNFTDPDLTDTHQVSVAVDSAVWSANSFLPGDISTDLQTALATTLHDSSGTGSGGIDWSFSVPDKDLDFLSAGETLTVTYDVTVQDAFTSSMQQVTVVINGASDPTVVHPLTVPVADTGQTDAGHIVAAGNVITDAGDGSADFSTNTTLSVTAVNGDSSNVDNFVSGTYGDLFIDTSGAYFYIANPALDALSVGQNPTDSFTFTVSDGQGHDFPTTLTFNVTGGDDPPVITSADTVGSVSQGLGPSVVVNGGFESGDLTGWTTSGSHITVDIPPAGGQFGEFAARLGPHGGGPETLSQDVATTPGQTYVLDFFVTGDPDSSGNSLTVNWDGTQVLAQADNFSGGFTEYTFTVTGDASHSTTPLSFSFSDDGTGMFLDQVTVESTSGPPTETSDGTIHFSDETPDTHTASVTPQANYFGTFSLDPVTDGPGSGSVGWHFSVDNSDIQFLAQGQTLTQVYTVTITDNGGASVSQDVTITIHGGNDAPTAQTVVTDDDANGSVVIPDWALLKIDGAPDTQNVVNVGNGTGGTASHAGGNVTFADDATLGGSFSYQVTDGTTTTPPVTAAVDNNTSGTSPLNAAASGNSILIGEGGETLNGGAGNDVLFGNGGFHTMTGGAGDDVFAFLQTTDGGNTFTDFNNTSEHDLLAVSASGFGSGLTAGMDVTPIFETSGDDQFQSTDSRFHFDTANDTLYFSTDGTTASAIALAQLTNGATLHPHDLIIVA